MSWVESRGVSAQFCFLPVYKQALPIYKRAFLHAHLWMGSSVCAPFVNGYQPFFGDGLWLNFTQFLALALIFMPQRSAPKQFFALCSHSFCQNTHWSEALTSNTIAPFFTHTPPQLKRSKPLTATYIQVALVPPPSTTHLPKIKAAVVPPPHQHGCGISIGWVSIGWGTCWWWSPC